MSERNRTELAPASGPATPSPSSAGVGGVHETPRAVPAARPVTARGPSVPREQTSRHGSVRVDARRAPCCRRGFSSPFVWKDKHEVPSLPCERLYHNKCTAISRASRVYTGGVHVSGQNTAFRINKSGGCPLPATF